MIPRYLVSEIIRMDLSFSETEKTNGGERWRLEVRSLVLNMLNVRYLKLGKQLDLRLDSKMRCCLCV